MKKIFKFNLIMLSVFTPMVTLAQGTSCASGLLGVLCKLNSLLSALLPFLVALGVIYFVWGVVQYVIGDSEEAKTKGKDQIIYGIIGLAVIVSIWGLVNVVVETFGVGQNIAPPVDKLIVASGDSSGCKIGTKVQGVLSYVTCVIGSTVIPFIFALATLMFIWGAVKFFIIDADDQEKRSQGKQFMLWGIIALAVMISVWGLVTILGDTFGLQTKVLPQVKP